MLYIPPITKQNLSPAVRKIVEENQIDVSKLSGSGKDGRVAKGDLLHLMSNTLSSIVANTDPAVMPLVATWVQKKFPLTKRRRGQR